MDQTQDVRTLELAPVTGASCAATADMRKAPRFPMTSAIRIRWVDCQRQLRYVTGQGVDISEGGLGVRLPVQLRAGALVNLELAGSGQLVCQRCSRGCDVGDRRFIGGRLIRVGPLPDTGNTSVIICWSLHGHFCSLTAPRAAG